MTDHGSKTPRREGATDAELEELSRQDRQEALEEENEPFWSAHREVEAGITALRTQLESATMRVTALEQAAEAAVAEALRLRELCTEFADFLDDQGWSNVAGELRRRRDEGQADLEIRNLYDPATGLTGQAVVEKGTPPLQYELTPNVAYENRVYWDPNTGTEYVKSVEVGSPPQPYEKLPPGSDTTYVAAEDWKGVLPLPEHVNKDAFREALEDLGGKRLPVHAPVGAQGIDSIVGWAQLADAEDGIAATIEFVPTLKGQDLQKLLQFGERSRMGFSIGGTIKQREGNVITEMEVNRVDFVSARRCPMCAGTGRVSGGKEHDDTFGDLPCPLGCIAKDDRNE